MLHEISPHIFENQYTPREPIAGSFGLLYEKNTVIARKNGDGTFDLPTFRELEPENAGLYESENLTYLFSVDRRGFYLLKAEELKLPKTFTWGPLREIMNTNPRHLAFAVVTGFQLHNWYENRKYCGRCGNLTAKDTKTRSLSCPACGLVEYPKIAPAVIVAVRDGDRLLLASYPWYDKYALLAGFAEIGETLEETVRREVMEETGLKVKNIRYYKSQPWPISDNLLAGFFCDLDGSDEIEFDKEELANAEWFAKNEIPLNENYDDGSLTFEMMRYFKGN